MQGGLTKASVVGALVGIGLMASALGVAAHDEIAAAGNGGTAEASATGGAIVIDDVNSGTNTGHAIGVGTTWGGVAVDGGAVANSTTLPVSADGGAAISDASGGDDNIAIEDAFVIVP